MSRPSSPKSLHSFIFNTRPSVWTYCRMNWTASSYFIPHSIRASATRTGALQGHTTFRVSTRELSEAMITKTFDDTRRHAEVIFNPVSSSFYDCLTLQRITCEEEVADQQWSHVSTWQEPKAHLPSPATQWTATQQPGSSLNFSFSRFSQSSTIWLEGGAPSSNGQSWGGTESRKWWRLHSFSETKTKEAAAGGGKQLEELPSCL